MNEYSGDFFLEGGNIAPALTLTAGLNGPQGVGFDQNGNLYVANGGTNQIAVFAQPIQNQQPCYLEGADNAGALAFDAKGNLFAASNDGSAGSIRVPTAPISVSTRRAVSTTATAETRPASTPIRSRRRSPRRA